jgi:hypothetical protein
MEWTRPISQPMDAKSEYQEGFRPMPNGRVTKAYSLSAFPNVKLPNPCKSGAQKVEIPELLMEAHSMRKPLIKLILHQNHQFSREFVQPKGNSNSSFPLHFIQIRVLTHRDQSYQFSGIRSGHRYYRRFQASRPEPMQSMRLAPVQG